MVDTAHYLQVYDLDLIYSWTPREFKNFIKGAQHKEIDDLERLAMGAMMTANASNGKRVTMKKLFDAKKARERLNKGSNAWKESRKPSVSVERHRRAKEAMNVYLKVHNVEIKSEGGR